MNAKKIDKIAIGTLYVIAGIIVTILAALILYILVLRNTTHQLVILD